MIPKKLDRSCHFSSSLNFSNNFSPSYLDVWHCHPELELNYNVSGKGMKFVGEYMASFRPGDLVLMGKNLPHRWLLDEECKESDINPKGRAESLVVHFKNNFAGEAFLKIPEMTGIEELLNKASLGLKFSRQASKKVFKVLRRMKKVNNYERLIEFLGILKILVKDDYHTLCSFGYQELSFAQKGNLGNVYEFIVNNFKDNITLEEVALIANMNKSSFCRLFKQVNGKTFTQYLNTIRIGYACKLIHEESEMNISEICYQSGFGNLSHFNRQFRSMMNTTPSNYLKSVG